MSGYGTILVSYLGGGQTKYFLDQTEEASWQRINDTIQVQFETTLQNGLQ